MVKHQEGGVLKAKREIEYELERGGVDKAQDTLDMHFPQYTHSCNYPSRCPLWDMCHDSPDEAVLTNPLELSTKFIRREAHHEGEKAQQERMDKDNE